jgi:hypothetical protein
MNQHVLSGQQMIPRNTLHEMIVDNKLTINVLTKHLTCVLLHFVSIARSGEAAKTDSVDYSVFFLIKMTNRYRKFINGHLKYYQWGHAENVRQIHNLRCGKEIVVGKARKSQWKKGRCTHKLIYVPILSTN